MPGRTWQVDSDTKAANIARLNRIEGQVRGLINMIEDDRCCVDILTQMGSVQQALRAVGREFLRNHLKYFAADALRNGGVKRNGGR